MRCHPGRFIQPRPSGGEPRADTPGGHAALRALALLYTLGKYGPYMNAWVRLECRMTSILEVIGYLVTACGGV